MRFDWQTDEDTWEEEPEKEAVNSAVPNRRLPYIIAALALIGTLFFIGTIITRSARNQVQERTTDLSTDVLAAYDLVNQAAITDDFDLFETFLSTNNSYSRQLPMALFRNHYFLDRPFLNLSAVDFPSSQEPTVNLSSDLSRAEVTSLQAYAPTGKTSFRPIWLERLTLMRFVDGRWQLSRWPIDETFWGETEEVRFGLLTAEFPARDEALGNRLGEDIGRLLDEVCGDEAINCPPNFRLKMILVPYGQSLLDMNANYRTLPLSSGYDAYRIFLPTPTLVGRPVDEAGYQVLYEGYAGWITAVLVQHYSQTRPVTQEVTAEFLAQWQLDVPPQPLLPGALVENYDDPQIPLPDQDILFICQGYSPARWLTYSPARDSWQAIPTPENSPVLAQLLEQAGQFGRFPPEGQGSLIRRPSSFTAGWNSFLWLGGLSNMLKADSPGLFLAGPGHQNQDEEHLLFYPFDGQGDPYLAETSECLGGNCQLVELAGIPVWSPFGGQTLITVKQEEGSPQLYTGDEIGRLGDYVDDGHSPKWLDESRFLYIGSDNKVLRHGRFDVSGYLIETNPLIDVSQINLAGQELALTYFDVHPNQPAFVFLAVVDLESQEDMIFLFDRETNNLISWFSLPEYRFSFPFYSTENGRFLTLTAFERDSLSGGWQLFVFDLEQNFYGGSPYQFQTESAFFDWSDDGKWLLLAEDNALRLVAPVQDYERTIPHDLGCHSVGWAE